MTQLSSKATVRSTQGHRGTTRSLGPLRWPPACKGDSLAASPSPPGAVVTSPRAARIRARFWSALPLSVIALTSRLAGIYTDECQRRPPIKMRSSAICGGSPFFISFCVGAIVDFFSLTFRGSRTCHFAHQSVGSGKHTQSCEQGTRGNPSYNFQGNQCPNISRN